MPFDPSGGYMNRKLLKNPALYAWLAFKRNNFNNLDLTTYDGQIRLYRKYRAWLVRNGSKVPPISMQDAGIVFNNNNNSQTIEPSKSNIIINNNINAPGVPPVPPVAPKKITNNTFVPFIDNTDNTSVNTDNVDDITLSDADDINVDDIDI